MIRSSVLSMVILGLALSTATAQDKPAKDPVKASEFRASSLDEEYRDLQLGSGPRFEIARRNLKQRGKAAFPKCLDLLDNKKLPVVSAVLDLLQALDGHPDAEAKLLELYHAPRSRFGDSDFLRVVSIRRKAAFILGRMQSAKAYDLFLKVVAGPKSDEAPLQVQAICSEALKAFGASKTDEYIKEFKKCLAEGRKRAASRLILVFGGLNDPKARDFLLATLKNYPQRPNNVIRHHCAIALQNFGDASVVPALVEILGNETDHYVQKYLTRTLNALTGESLPVNALRWKSWLAARKSNKQSEAQPTGEAVPQIDVDSFGKD